MEMKRNKDNKRSKIYFLGDNVTLIVFPGKIIFEILSKEKYVKVVYELIPVKHGMVLVSRRQTTWHQS